MHEQLPNNEAIVRTVTIGEQNIGIKEKDPLVLYDVSHQQYDHVLIRPDTDDELPVRYFPEDHQEIYDLIREGLPIVLRTEPDQNTLRSHAAMGITDIEVAAGDIISGFDQLLSNS